MDNLTGSKNLYVVLGMPRSGTSAITRGLKALGIDLGDKLTGPSKKWNQKGYFEDNDIVYLVNRKILYTVCDEWETTKLIQPEQLNIPAVKEIRILAMKLLRERIESASQWGFKDPRTARLLPFWRSIFTELHLHDQYIIALRNPLASADSLHHLQGIDIEKGLLLWLAHLIPAIDETQGKNRLVVHYNLMLENPRHQLERIQKTLDLTTSVNDAEVDLYANEFLDKSLQHYEYTLEDFKSHPASLVVPLCVKTYELLLKLAKDELQFSDPAFISAWQEIKCEFDSLYPLYCYMDNLLKSKKMTERSIRTIHKSVPYKLIFPLRVIDDKLRVLRRKRVLRKRIEKA